MKRDESVLEINQLRLDEEWVNQPKLYLEYAAKLADARRDLDLSKSELELTVAELDADIRADPEGHDIGEKVTENAIKNCIPTLKRYQVANNALIDAKHKVDVLQAFVNALDHRKRALENLVDLHGQSYFAEPRARKEEDREAMTEAKDRMTMKRGQRKRHSKENSND